MIDIVVSTCNRLELLKRTVETIQERTSSDYRLHVIDDASTEDNIEYLAGLQMAGVIETLIAREKRAGITANLRAILGITCSNPVVFTDDDVLCPKLEPDWLYRGLMAMEEHPELGMLALNNPQCNVGDKRRRGEVSREVTYCRNVGGTFTFVRRDVLKRCLPAGEAVSPVKEMCFEAARRRWKVGYLTNVYCQHIGLVSMRSRLDMAEELRLTAPINDDTLEPADVYKG